MQNDWMQWGQWELRGLLLKLLLIKDMMNIDCAKSIAWKRDEYMRGFLKEFNDEWNG